MRSAERVFVTPSFVCGGYDLDALEMEIQLAAVTAGRPINAVYNPRLQDDCAASMVAATRGPWDARTLYVYLQSAGVETVPADWRPLGLACQPFDRGLWCLGTSAGQ